MRRRILQIIFGVLVMIAALFLSAGRLDWPMGWVVVGIYVAGMAMLAPLLMRKSPDLVAERARFGGPGAKTWDKWLGTMMGSVGPLVTWIVAGLDHRFTWSAEMPTTWRGVAVGLAIFGYAVVCWAMLSNRFFSAVVRIQKDRGHTTITGGPYRFVRHPGYAGMLMMSLMTPVLLGSVWAFVPAAAVSVVTVIRTALEDRTLQRELEGYADYAAAVRSRLIPGVW